MFQRVLLPLCVHDGCISIRSMWEGNYRMLSELIESKDLAVGILPVRGWRGFIAWLSVVVYLCVLCVKVSLGWGWAVLGGGVGGCFAGGCYGCGCVSGAGGELCLGGGVGGGGGGGVCRVCLI